MCKTWYISFIRMVNAKRLKRQICKVPTNVWHLVDVQYVSVSKIRARMF